MVGVRVQDMMTLTEELIRACARAVRGSERISYQGVDIDLAQPFRRATMRDLVKDASGYDACML